MYVVSKGMICPVGLTAASACAAMRAGISAFEELEYFASTGEPIVGADIQDAEGTLEGQEWFEDMLFAALVDCLTEEDVKDLKRVPLLVGVAELDRPGDVHNFVESIIPRVERKLGLNFHPLLSKVIARGHTAGFHGLRLARQLLTEASVDACLICGVDSYIDRDFLLYLEENQRLKIESDSDGLIPGEAAAAVLVRREPSSHDGSAVGILGIGFGHEQAGVLSEDPLLGLGLTDATRAALAEANLAMHQIDFRFADVTGESYGMKEQLLAMARVMRRPREEIPIWHCAEFIGDTGAAASLCGVILACHAMECGYAPGSRAICSSGAVSGDRAVVVLKSNKG